LLEGTACATFGFVNWIVFAMVAALALAAADVCVKSAAGKLPDSLGMLLYGVVPFSIGLVWFSLDRTRAAAPALDFRAVLFALAVGVMFSLVTFAMYAAFRRGAPLSLASPLIRLGGLILASAVGFLVWKEPLTLRYAVGFILACAGVYLMIVR
jgi:drug/metabolite transporter (DMT)-like permease